MAVYRKVRLPDNLSEVTENYIHEVIDYLKKNDKLNAIDSGTIYMLASSYDQYIKASEIVNREGMTVAGSRNTIVAHPAVRIAKDAKSLALNIMTQMGLTLKSRTKLNQIDPDTEDTPLTEFMKSMI